MVLKKSSTRIDLNQVAAAYSLFTGSTQAVTAIGLIVTCPDLAAAGALTSIRIHTNHTTNQEFISIVDGAVAELTAENQLFWEGLMYIGVGDIIQLTIAGGATAAKYRINVDVLYYANTNGGELTPA